MQVEAYDRRQVEHMTRHALPGLHSAADLPEHSATPELTLQMALFPLVHIAFEFTYKL